MIVFEKYWSKRHRDVITSKTVMFFYRRIFIFYFFNLLHPFSWSSWKLANHFIKHTGKWQCSEDQDWLISTYPVPGGTVSHIKIAHILGLNFSLGNSYWNSLIWSVFNKFFSLVTWVICIYKTYSFSCWDFSGLSWRSCTHWPSFSQWTGK